MPHCQELEELGLHGYVKEMLHVIFVCQTSNTRISNLHKLLDVVDLAEACVSKYFHLPYSYEGSY